MPAKCDACGKFVGAADTMGCLSCPRAYHYQCLNLTPEEFRKLTKEERKMTKCVSCKIEERSKNPPRSADGKLRQATVSPSSTAASAVNAAFPTGIITAATATAAAASTSVANAANSAVTPSLAKDDTPGTTEPSNIITVAADVTNAILTATPLPHTESHRAPISSNTATSGTFLIDLEKRLELIILKGNESLKKEIREMLKAEIASHVESLTAEMDGRLAEVESQCSRICELEKNLQASQERIIELENEFGTHQQWLRMNNLEISGVPEMNNESITNVAIQIASHAGVILQSGDIEFAHRVQPVKAVPGRPKNIIVKLRQRLHKDEIISGLRKTKGVYTSDLGYKGDSKKLYVHDHLTPLNKKLLKDCKAVCNEHNYTYVWVKHCNIYVRKAMNCPQLHIRSSKDFAKIV